MKIGFALAATLIAAGCATVVRGTRDNAKFESEPSGATVTVESISSDKLGPFECKTPCELELKRKREWNVVFTLDGYKPANGVLKPKVTGGGVASGAGNVIAGGIIGIGVDAGTGANLDLRPNPMKARLAPADSVNASVVLSEDEVKTAKKSPKSPETPAASTAESTTQADPAAPVESAPPAPEVLTMDPVDSADDAAGATDGSASAAPQD